MPQVNDSHKEQINAVVNDVEAMFVEDFEFESQEEAEKVKEALYTKMDEMFANMDIEDNLSICRLMEEED